jgi:hypothetical protein
MEIVLRNKEVSTSHQHKQYNAYKLKDNHQSTNATTPTETRNTNLQCERKIAINESTMHSQVNKNNRTLVAFHRTPPDNLNIWTILRSTLNLQASKISDIHKLSGGNQLEGNFI